MRNIPECCELLNFFSEIFSFTHDVEETDVNCYVVLTQRSLLTGKHKKDISLTHNAEWMGKLVLSSKTQKGLRRERKSEMLQMKWPVVIFLASPLSSRVTGLQRLVLFIFRTGTVCWPKRTLKRYKTRISQTEEDVTTLRQKAKKLEQTVETLTNKIQDLEDRGRESKDGRPTGKSGGLGRMRFC
ncbi:hypothetical protein ROHU_012254 [Labeo rohita]|uniref:Uncharacterized protein n=1 Tax=Labeo rohita TaxID=84645 RepID=A0A498LM43_LABRO|nr:hypothetical protein ROHU_012254 [Labeo rohita]